MTFFFSTNRGGGIVNGGGRPWSVTNTSPIVSLLNNGMIGDVLVTVIGK